MEGKTVKMLLTLPRRGRLKKAKQRNVYGWSISYTLGPIEGISSALPKLTSAQSYKEHSYRPVGKKDCAAQEQPQQGALRLIRANVKSTLYSQVTHVLPRGQWEVVCAGQDEVIIGKESPGQRRDAQN